MAGFFPIMNAVLVMAALMVDRGIGDPKNWLHPVQIIGWLINRLETKWNRASDSTQKKRWLGGLMAALVILFSALATWGIIALFARVSPLLAGIADVWLISTTIAWKGLMDAGRQVASALAMDGLEAARKEVSMIVGRDTQQLDELEVIRATVETLAENLVDGVMAPVLFGLLGQAPLAMAYRAINTLDSMVGYKNDRFRDFGYGSAKLDDVANWLPARITGWLMLMVLFFMKKNVVTGYRILRRDAKKHPSPNGGIPEAVVAGGLGVRLGGYNSYHGKVSFRAYLGDDTRPLQVDDIGQTIRIIQNVVILAMILLAVLGSGWWR